MDELDDIGDRVGPWIARFFASGASALSPREVVGVGVWLLEVEVNNGGFDQYYFNAAGALAIDTVGALEAIGARRAASLLMAANAEFPGAAPPMDRALRQQVLAVIRNDARFAVLEQEFYRDEDDRLSLLAAYLRAPPHVD